MNENSIHTGSPHSRRAILIIVAVALVVVAIAVIAMTLTAPPDPRDSVPPPSPTPQDTSSTVTPAPTSPSSATSHGSDASRRFGTPSRDLVTTGEMFVRGWLETDPDRRERLLSQSATPELTAKLMLTAPANIPAEQVDNVEVTGQAAHSGEIRVTFTSGDQLMLYLAYDPVAHTEWAVFSIAEWG